MNGKASKNLRRLTKFSKVPEKTQYNVSRPASWGRLPLNEDGSTNKKSLAKLISKTINPKFKEFANITYFRYVKGVSRRLTDCQRSFYKQLKRSYNAG